MKILFGMPSPDSWGGPVTCEPPLVDAIRPLVDAAETMVYVYGDKKRKTRTLERVRRVLRTAFRLRRILRAGDFDVVHLNTAFDRRSVLRDTVSIFLAGRTKARYFLKVHGASPDDFTDASWWQRSLIRFLRSRVSGFGVHTEEEMAGLERIGLDRSRFHVTRNAIVVNRARPEGYVRKHLPPDGRFRILFASRFIETKGLLETIRACALLKERGFDVVLDCAGDGPLLDEAQALVAEQRLGDVVNFTGYIPTAELDRLYFESDLFVFPTSHVEGFPIVLFSAVAAGLPIVTTRTRAAKDFLAEPANCLFSGNDPASIADRVQTLIADISLRQRMSEENERYGERLSPDRMAREYLNIYEAVLNS